jgi:hypothetical protein
MFLSSLTVVFFGLGFYNAVFLGDGLNGAMWFWFCIATFFSMVTIVLISVKREGNKNG